MPMYEFECCDCGNRYDEYVIRFDETGKWEGIKCPQCTSENKSKLFSACNHVFANPEGTDKMNSHDFRAKHAINKPGGAKDQRAMAEKLSHMGSKPYNNIDDISSGKHFGEVK